VVRCPIKIYAHAFLQFALGQLVGSHDSIVLGERGPVIPIVLAMLHRSWLVSRTSKTPISSGQ
jgi:hypothetical protein